MTTQTRFQSEFYASSIAERQTFDMWVERDEEDVVQRAYAIWPRMLRENEVPPSDVGIREELGDYVARGEGSCGG